MPQDGPGELRKAVLTYNVTLSSASLVTSLPIDLYRLDLRDLPFDPDSAHVPRRTSLCRHMKRKQNDVARCRADGSTIIALVPDRCDLVPSGCALCLLLLYRRTNEVSSAVRRREAFALAGHCVAFHIESVRRSIIRYHISWLLQVRYRVQCHRAVVCLGAEDLANASTRASSSDNASKMSIARPSLVPPCPILSS